ncbi:MAG: glycosyltransferase [Candidatus Tectimicrobiota bacterium]
MHIAVVNLTQGGLSGGSRKYLRALLPVWLQDERVERLSLFVPSPTVADFADPALHVQSWPADDHWRRYATLKSTLQQLAPDVIFLPTARWLTVDDIPTVIMVRNMEPLVLPGGGNRAGEWLKNLLRASAARNACRRATRIIAVSQYVQDFLQQRWGIQPSKLGMVYHGVDPLDTKELVQTPAWMPHNETTPFLFTAGSIRPARGLEDIVEALGLLRQRGFRQTLVIAGAVDPAMQFYQRRLCRLASQYNITDQLVWAGHLAPQEMAWCFRHCSAFVMTSRVEACPNIALEAMSHGCLCVSSSNPPMPEFFRDIALYYQAGDAHSLAQQLDVLSHTPAEQKSVRQRAAKIRTQQFQWHETAQATLGQLTLALEQGLLQKGRSGALI